MKYSICLTLGSMLFATSCFAQSNVQLPLEASNCAIYKALNLKGNAACDKPRNKGTTRGIVLKMDEELAKQERQDLGSMFTKQPVAPKPKVKTVKAPAPVKKKNPNHAAAQSKGGYFIQFALNSFELEPAFEAHLGKLAQVLNSAEMTNTCIRVTGHTDTSGSDQYNKKLSENRAVIVATRLSELGEINPTRIQISAAGETQPLPNIDGHDALNRRVEFSTKEATNGCSI